MDEATDSRNEKRRLAYATLLAFLVAVLLLLVAILPAEYGVDPTGFGRAMGFTRLREASTPPLDENITVTSRFAFQGTWTAQWTSLPPIQGYTKHEATSVVTVPIALANVTRVVARLDWSDANETAGTRTEPDFFEVQVQAPSGRVGTPMLARNEPGGTGRVNATLDWRPTPTVQEVEADTASEAEAQLLRSVPADATGQGEWRVNVTLVLAGGSDQAALPLGGSVVDDGNAWTLTVSVQTFRLDTQRLATARVRADNATILVAPGKGLEFKLTLNESQRFEYDWSTRGGPIYYDFHGQKTTATSDEYTSHKKGSAVRDRGALVAPFTGFHGWYFENRGTEDVTLELDLRGVYSIYGRV